MNAMHALKFFLEIICGVAVGAVASTWVMLFFLRLKVRKRRYLRAVRDAQKNAPEPRVELAPH
jgi:hypothetical protein